MSVTSENQSSAVDIFTLDEVLAQQASSSSIELIKGSGQVMGLRDDAPAASVADGPPPATLFDLLQKSTKVPSSTGVAAVPSSMSADDAQNLEDVLLLNSYISVASMRYLYTIQPTGWDITNPAGASAFAKSAANAKFKILTDGLGSFLSLDTTSARQFSQNTTSADLHLGFLSSLFAGFGFSPATMAELDNVLTSVNNTLSDLKLSWSDQSETLDHLVFTYSFQPVQGLDGVKLPQMRLFFLHIDQASWSASVGKSSIQHFQFNMNFDDLIFNMNPQQVANNREQIQQLISTMTGQSFDAVNQLLTPTAVSGDTTTS